MSNLDKTQRTIERIRKLQSDVREIRESIDILIEQAKEGDGQLDETDPEFPTVSNLRQAASLLQNRINQLQQRLGQEPGSRAEDWNRSADELLTELTNVLGPTANQLPPLPNVRSNQMVRFVSNIDDSLRSYSRLPQGSDDQQGRLRQLRTYRTLLQDRVDLRAQSPIDMSHFDMQPTEQPVLDSGAATPQFAEDGSFFDAPWTVGDPGSRTVRVAAGGELVELPNSLRALMQEELERSREPYLVEENGQLILTSPRIEELLAGDFLGIESARHHRVSLR